MGMILGAENRGLLALFLPDRYNYFVYHQQQWANDDAPFSKIYSKWC